MKLVTRYILWEHLGPFLFGMATITSVFLLNLVFRDLDRLLGKGLPAGVVIEFFVLNLAWIVALAVPMSVLIATLMAFGRLSADHEMTALKAGGIHFYRLMAPVLLMAGLLAVAMERFNNCVLPDFNHRVRILTSDISKKRPTLTLEPHVFFDEIPGYSMLVHEIKGDGSEMRNVIINNQSDPDISETIIAERGHIRFSEEQEKMILTLSNGEIHRVELQNLEKYTRVTFGQHVISVNMDNMILKRSNSGHRGDREKSAGMMRKDIRRNRETIKKHQERIRDLVQTGLTNDVPASLLKGESMEIDVMAYLGKMDHGDRTQRDHQKLVQQIEGERRIINGYRRSISALSVEVHKKYSIPVACLVFVLIGAPLGMMSRQGGLAAGSVLSIVFFLVFWTFLIGGEQLADRQMIHPALAMWAPDLLMGILGLGLVIRSVHETTVIPWERWADFFRKRNRGEWK